MEQKFRKFLAAKEKGLTAELEYGPWGNDARIPLVLKGAPEALAQIVQHECPLGMASKDRPETWVSPDRLQPENTRRGSRGSEKNISVCPGLPHVLIPPVSCRC